MDAHKGQGQAEQTDLKLERVKKIAQRDTEFRTKNTQNLTDSLVYRVWSRKMMNLVDF